MPRCTDQMRRSILVLVARLVFKVRGRRVGEVRLADARLTRSQRGAVRFLRSFR